MSKEEKDSGLALTALAVLLVPTIVLHGWATATLWGWFVVPALHAPTLSIGHAIGISMLFRYLTRHASKPGEKRPSAWHTVGVGIASPLMVVGAGWLVKTWF